MACFASHDRLADGSLKLLADVNISALVVARLRDAGVEVTRVVEIMDRRASDAEIVAAARQRDAVLLSHDQDFGALLAIAGANKPSLINLRTSSVDVDFLTRCILRALATAASELSQGAIVTMEDGGMRVRGLPIGRE